MITGQLQGKVSLLPGQRVALFQLIEKGQRNPQGIVAFMIQVDVITPLPQEQMRHHYHQTVIAVAAGDLMGQPVLKLTVVMQVQPGFLPGFANGGIYASDRESLRIF